jgi:hypothetical protein
MNALSAAAETRHSLPPIFFPGSLPLTRSLRTVRAWSWSFSAVPPLLEMEKAFCR